MQPRVGDAAYAALVEGFIGERFRLVSNAGDAQTVGAMLPQPGSPARRSGYKPPPEAALRVHALWHVRCQWQAAPVCCLSHALPPRPPTLPADIAPHMPPTTRELNDQLSLPNVLAGTAATAALNGESLLLKVALWVVIQDQLGFGEGFGLQESAYDFRDDMRERVGPYASIWRHYGPQILTLDYFTKPGGKLTRTLKTLTCASDGDRWDRGGGRGGGGWVMARTASCSMQTWAGGLEAACRQPRSEPRTFFSQFSASRAHLPAAHARRSSLMRSTFTRLLPSGLQVCCLRV